MHLAHLLTSYPCYALLPSEARTIAEAIVTILEQASDDEGADLLGWVRDYLADACARSVTGTTATLQPILDWMNQVEMTLLGESDLRAARDQSPTGLT